MTVQQQKVNMSRLNGRIETIACKNPGTGETFAEAQMATAHSVREARREMGVVAQVWAKKSVRERVRIMRKLQKLIIDQSDEITAVLNQDGGKSRQDALTEVFVTVDIMNQYNKYAAHWLRRRRVSPGLQLFKKAYVERRPRGVVAVISPWNYPFVLTIPPIITALLAGNTVIVKPSEVTAAAGLMMEKLIQQIPELAPYVRFLHGDGRVGAAVVESVPDLIYVTGSVRTGRLITEAAAKTMTPVITELGSKDPLIVLDDADVETAAKWAVWGAFYNTGQTCTSVERVYVVEPVYEQFLTAVLAEVAQMKVGYSPEIDNLFDMAPFTFERQPEIVEAHLQDAVNRGARVLAGGKREGMFMEPTVVVDVDHSMQLMQEETFGPIMPIMMAKDEQHAIELANHSSFGLGASVWSNNIKRAKRVGEQIQAGTININDTITHFAIPHLPFGGLKESGNGRSHGEEDMLQFTQSVGYAVGKPPLPFDIATILRAPGNYRTSQAIMKLAFGVTTEQRLEPVMEYLEEREAKAKAAKVAAGVGVAAGATAVLFGWVRNRQNQ